MAEALYSIGNVRDIAAHLGSSEHTVRTQLKTSFLKTRTNRQPDLVKLLLSSPKRLG